METIDNLILLIDKELLNLNEAKTRESIYSHFNFRTALSMLNDALKKSGNNALYKDQISKYINVFNDLCNTEMEAVYFRRLSFDPNTDTLEFERKSCVANKDIVTIEKSEIGEKDRSRYMKMVLPEEDYKQLYRLCKFDYLLKKCKTSYEKIGENKRRPRLHPDILHKGDSFDSMFSLDVNYWLNRRITFEEYIEELEKHRSIISAIANSSEKNEPYKTRDDLHQNTGEERLAYFGLDTINKIHSSCTGDLWASMEKNKLSDALNFPKKNGVKIKIIEKNTNKVYHLLNVLLDKIPKDEKDEIERKQWEYDVKVVFQLKDRLSRYSLKSLNISDSKPNAKFKIFLDTL